MLEGESAGALDDGEHVPGEVLRSIYCAWRTSAAKALLSDNGKVIARSVPAERMISAGDAIRVIDGRLCLADARANMTLQAALMARLRADTYFFAPSVKQGEAGVRLRVATLRQDGRDRMLEIDMRRVRPFPVSRLVFVARSYKLSPTETKVLCRVLRGLSTEAAAAALQMSPETAKSHLQKIYLKCGVNSRPELFERVMRYI